MASTHRLLQPVASSVGSRLRASRCLSTEAVESASLALERIDDVESRDGLAARMLSVGDGIADDVLEEDLEDATGLLVDETADALNTTTACQTTDSGLLQLFNR